jgi:hypothetical protein
MATLFRVKKMTSPLVDPYLELFVLISTAVDTDEEHDSKEQDINREDGRVIRAISRIPNFSPAYEPPEHCHDGLEFTEPHNVVTWVCENRLEGVLRWLIRKYGKEVVSMAASSGNSPLHTLLNNTSNYMQSRFHLTHTMYALLRDTDPTVLHAISKNGRTPLFHLVRKAVEKFDKHDAEWARLVEQELTLLGVQMMKDGALLCPYLFHPKSEMANDFHLSFLLPHFLPSFPIDVSQICCEYLKDPIFKLYPSPAQFAENDLPYPSQRDLVYKDEQLAFIEKCFVKL